MYSEYSHKYFKKYAYILFLFYPFRQQKTLEKYWPISDQNSVLIHFF